MIIRSLDAAHDWTYGKGRNNYLRQNDAIAENIDTRLLCFLGDCFFDVTAGIDWFNYLGGKDKIGLQLAIASVILNSYGVTALVELSLNLDPAVRLLSINYEINTIYSGQQNQSTTVANSANFILTQDGIIITTEDGNPLTT